MKLNNFKRFLVEDFKEQKSWIPRLLDPLNKFLEDTTSILNGGITLRDNVVSQVYDVALKYDATNARWFFQFKYLPKIQPTAVIIVKCVEDGANKFTAAVAPACNWSYEEGQIYIRLDSSSFNTSKTYNIRVLCLV